MCVGHRRRACFVFQHINTSIDFMDDVIIRAESAIERVSSVQRVIGEVPIIVVRELGIECLCVCGAGQCVPWLDVIGPDGGVLRCRGKGSVKGIGFDDLLLIRVIFSNPIPLTDP